MKSFFDGLSYSDLLKKVTEAVEALNYSPSDRFLQIHNKENARHDVWNMYAYGNLIKVVYIKKHAHPLIKLKAPNNAKLTFSTRRAK